MSVSPSVYETISSWISSHGRPSSGWMRVIVEKPFGRDEASARDLASKMSQHLKDHETLRVDHYLGKFLVMAIPLFRIQNPQYEEKVKLVFM